MRENADLAARENRETEVPNVDVAVEELSEESGAEPISVRADIERLAGDFREFLTAEMRYYQARLTYSKTLAKWTGVYLAIALFSLFGAVVAVILGLLLIISAYTGPLWATLIVSLTFCGVGFWFARLAHRTTRKFKFAELSETDD